MAWGPGLIKKKNRVDRESIFSAIDLVPTLLALTNTPAPKGTKFDGESLPGTLLGKGGSRQAPIYFRRPPDRNSFYDDQDLPDLALRKGKWKFLCEYNGSEPELYDLQVDRGETNNLAHQHSELVKDLTEALISWHQSLPPDNGATYGRKNKGNNKK